MTNIWYNSIFKVLRGVAQLVECTLWERDVAGSSPVSPIGGIMKENDKLPTIIAAIATVVYIAFILTISKLADKQETRELQGGNIEKAIQTGQYR